MVGFSAYAWQANQPFFVYWGRRTLKPLTPGEVAASADGEGNVIICGQPKDACPYKVDHTLMR